MLQYAIEGGHVDAADLCMQWGLKKPISQYTHHIQQCRYPVNMLVFLNLQYGGIILPDPTQFTIMNWEVDLQTTCIAKIIRWRYEIDHNVLAVQAAACRNLSAIHYIWFHGADMDVDAVLIAAAKSGSPRIIELMYQYGAEDTKGALAVATKPKTIALLQSHLDESD